VLCHTYGNDGGVSDTKYVSGVISGSVVTFVCVDPSEELKASCACTLQDANAIANPTTRKIFLIFYF